MTQRESEIDDKVMQIISSVSQNLSTYRFTQERYMNPEPRWDEIRDSIVRCLFALDRDQHELEIDAQDVVDNCI